MLSTNIEVKINRSFAIHGKAFSHGSVTRLFIDVCDKIHKLGRGRLIHDELRDVKRALAVGSGPNSFSIKDTERIVRAFNAKSEPESQIVLKKPILEIVIIGAGDKINYFRLVKGGMTNKLGPLVFDLDEDVITKILLAVVDFRSLTSEDISEMAAMRFRAHEMINVRKTLDTVYRATFSRDVRGSKCDKRMVINLTPGTFTFKEEGKILRICVPFFELFRHFVLGLNQTPDLGTVVDVTTPHGVLIRDGLRMLIATISDSVSMPEMIRRVEALKRQHNKTRFELEPVNEEGEELLELEEA